MTEHLASPNFITSQLFIEAARQLHEMRDDEDNFARVASVIILVMSGLESFLNSYFHQLAFQLNKKELLKIITAGRDSKGRIPTKTKILNWPKEISGKSIDPDSSAYKNYEKVRGLRDKLVHYKPDCMEWGYFEITPHHKTSLYKSLTKRKGEEALRAILEILGAIGAITEGRDKKRSKMVFIASWSGCWLD